MHQGTHFPPSPFTVVGWVVMVFYNAAAWVYSIDAGKVATSITIVGGAVAGVLYLGITQVGRAQAIALKEKNDALKDALQPKLDEANRLIAENGDRIAQIEAAEKQCEKDREELRAQVLDGDRRVIGMLEGLLEQHGVVIKKTTTTEIAPKPPEGNGDHAAHPA